jgi:hypothetical protein
MGIAYDYEPERLNLSSGESYLPDFFLADFRAYFEVKPSSESIVTEECVRARALSRDRPKQRVWLAMGCGGCGQGKRVAAQPMANSSRYR